MDNGQSFASTSLTRHLIRGVVGFGTLIGSVLLLPLVGPVSLLLAPVGLLALRGCPTCWAVGLVQTLSMGRLERTCVDGRCELQRAELSGDPLGAQALLTKPTHALGHSRSGSGGPLGASEPGAGRSGS